MNDLVVILTVKEYAAREQVSQRTVRTWIQKGVVKIRRTPGRGIRIVLPPDRAPSRRQE